MKYSEQLLTPEWKEKRLRILKRDNYSCNKCGSNSNLQVHHELYERGKMAWQIDDKYLITVCKPCHEEIHSKRHISTFYKQNKKAKQKKINKPSKWRSNLNEKELKIQKLYDDRRKKLKLANLPEPKTYKRLVNPIIKKKRKK